MDSTGTRFADTDVTFDGPSGPITGRNLEVPSADPVNYHQVITTGDAPPKVIDGKLFLRPDRSEPQPLVIVVPGSLGVGPNHIAHARSLFDAGYATFLLDPFGARSVTSTVADQTRYSFAASAYDVLATLQLLRTNVAVDADRIAAQGHSRGGAAVITAAMRRFADAVVGPEVGLAGVYAVYPWCGHQFSDPGVDPVGRRTTVRAVIGDLDQWCSVQQVQAQVQAIASTGGQATVSVVAGAHHSFDREQPPATVPEAAVAPAAPTATIADDGSLIDPYTGRADPALTDRDLFVAAMKAGHGRTGAVIGSVGGQAEMFTADMLSFHARTIGPVAEDRPG